MRVGYLGNSEDVLDILENSHGCFGNFSKSQRGILVILH